jgi:hypothetical protein
MCLNVPCIPTPAGAAELIKAGYKQGLAPTCIIDRLSGLVNYVIAPIMTSRGCVFLDHKNHCILHDKGLKPLEGKLAHHGQLNNGLQMYVARKWDNEPAQRMVSLFEILK